MLMLADRLGREGWEVPLIVLRGSQAARSGAWPGRAEEAGIGSLSSPVSWIRAFVLAVRLRTRGYRLVQLFLNDTALLLPPFMRMLGIKVIISRRDMGIWYTPGRLRLLRLLRPAVNLVIANSRAVAELTCRAEGYDGSEVVVMMNGLVDDEHASDANNDPARPGKTIGIVANVRPVKRLEDAIKAFSMIASSFPDAELRIVGGGDASGLRALACELGLSDRVVTTGRVQDPGREIARFDVAMLTSESEGLSNALMEYMNAGRPVVCTDAGGNGELVEHGLTGFLCDVGNTDAMAGRLAELLSDPGLRARMGKAGRARIRALCDPGRAAQLHGELYVNLLETGAPGQRVNTLAGEP